MDKAHPFPVLESPQFDLHNLASQLDFVIREALLPDLQAETKSEAIRRMVAALASAGAIPHDREAEVVAAVWHREKQGTTAIGRGVAIPHAKHQAVREVVATVAFSSAGIDFDSLDRQKVHLIVLVLSPVDAVGKQLQALQQVAMRLTRGGSWN